MKHGIFQLWKNLAYCSRATTGRSPLVAATIRFQAKNRFLCDFYVAIWWPKMQFLNCGGGLQWRGYCMCISTKRIYQWTRSCLITLIWLILGIYFWEINLWKTDYFSYLLMCWSSPVSTVFKSGLFISFVLWMPPFWHSFAIQF